MHCESKVITLPMPSAVCSARTSFRTLTASLRVAGRQLQSTTSAKPSTTCSTPDTGVRSRDREWPLLEPCLKVFELKINLNFSQQLNLYSWNILDQPARRGSYCCSALLASTGWWAAAASLQRCPAGWDGRRLPLGRWSRQSLRERLPATRGNPPSALEGWWRQGHAAPHPCGWSAWKKEREKDIRGFAEGHLSHSRLCRDVSAVRLEEGELLGQKLYQVLSAHAIWYQSRDGGHTRTEQIDLWLPLSPVAQTAGEYHKRNHNSNTKIDAWIQAVVTYVIMSSGSLLDICTLVMLMERPTSLSRCRRMLSKAFLTCG